MMARRVRLGQNGVPPRRNTTSSVGIGRQKASNVGLSLHRSREYFTRGEISSRVGSPKTDVAIRRFG